MPEPSTPPIPTLYCSHFEGRPPCCESCHSDQDEGYEMCDHEFRSPNRTILAYADICCNTYRWLNPE